jgi:serine/threonine protein kinase
VLARLRLFLRVCKAVSYAHAALVVHRDLEPETFW